MERRKCEVTGLEFEISNFESEYCRREGIPLPTISPFERLRHLSSFRNRLHLYPGECAKTNKKGLTSIPPSRGLVVYDVDYWESDEWSAFDYGRDYDFSRSFFDQFAELLKVVPMPNLSVIRSTMENSDHTNGITGAKNCYLIFSSSFNEDCMYGRLFLKNRNVYNSVLAHNCELCYGCKNVHSCYSVSFCQNCYHCSDSTFLANCQSCRNCYGCVNLSNREYCFYNQQLSKDQYLAKVQSIDLGSATVLEEEQKKFAAFRADFPLKYLEGMRNEGSTGNYLNGTKNCRDCFSTSEGEDLEHCMYVNGAKSCIATFGYGNSMELIYSSCTVGDKSYNVKFSVECWPGVRDLEYCFYVSRGSHDLFGCMGLKKQEYCVLNKQYSKEEYCDLVSRIKKQMLANGEYGRLFPKSFSPHAYNKSEAIDWFPTTKEHALKLGFTWRDPDPDEPGKAQEIPDHVQQVTEEMLYVPFVCELTGKRFRILKQELLFHQRMNLALPRVSPFERLRNGVDFIAVQPLRNASCAHCSTKLVTARPAEVKKVLCEECYQQALVS